MDCYNCGELGHLAHQCTKPKKDKFKNKGKKDNSSNEDEDEKKKNKPYKKRDGKKDFHKKKSGKAYIIGDWLMDIDSSSRSSDDESDNEKVAAIAIDLSSSPPPPPSSSTHLCLMAKGAQKVQNDDHSSGDDNASNDESGSDSDEEFVSPSYDDLVKLLNQYTKIIRKTRAKNKKLELEKDSLLAKYDIDKKS